MMVVPLIHHHQRDLCGQAGGQAAIIETQTDCHDYALPITQVIVFDVTSAILPPASWYSFPLVWVSDLGLGSAL